MRLITYTPPSVLGMTYKIVLKKVTKYGEIIKICLGEERNVAPP